MRAAIPIANHTTLRPADGQAPFTPLLTASAAAPARFMTWNVTPSPRSRRADTRP